ncbi:unnamed protein product, partial [Musa textilis]
RRSGGRLTSPRPPASSEQARTVGRRKPSNGPFPNVKSPNGTLRLLCPHVGLCMRFATREGC